MTANGTSSAIIPSSGAKKPNTPIPTITAAGNPFKLIGLMRHISKNPLQAAYEAWQQHGDVFRFSLLGSITTFIVHPQMVRHLLITHAKDLIKDSGYTDERSGLARFMGQGLVTSEGDFWKRQRKLAAPAFHTTRVNAYAETMSRYAEDRVKQWRDGATLDIAHEMMEVTMSVISYTLLHSVNLEEGRRIAASTKIIQDFSSDNLLLPWMLPTPANLRANKAQRILDEIVYRIIAERRADPTDRGDLLSMLMLTEGEDGERMTDKQLRDEVVTLFLAGHETTANALNWTFYQLAQHPEVEAKLHAELDSALNGRLPSMADLRNLPYTQQVIKEAMRLYPPVWAISRELVNEVEVEGHLLSKKTMVQFSPYLTHRHPDYWEQPNRFNPDRFSAENEAQRDKWAYFPFGGGQRVCIGQSFALLEASLMLATFASRVKLRLAPHARVEPRPAVTLYPKYGLPMVVSLR